MGEVALAMRLPRQVRTSMRAETEDAEAASQGRMEPTPERKRHGSVVEQSVVATEHEAARAGARVRRVQSPIERYFGRDQISQRQYDAAEDLRMDWEFGVIGVRRTIPGLIRVEGGTVEGYTQAQLDAGRRYIQATQAMGKRIADVVLPVVLGLDDGGEITAGLLAKRRGDPNEQQVMGILRTGLDMLGDHYAGCSDKRRAAKYG